jgi:hypothetical protein
MSRLLRTAAAVALPLALGACDWFTDFKNQPKLEPWEPVSQNDNDTTHAPRGNPQYSVPVTGTFVAGYQISYAALPGVIDSIAAVVTNPTPPSPGLAGQRAQVLPDQLRRLPRRHGRGQRPGDAVRRAGDQHHLRPHQGAPRRLHLGDPAQRARRDADVQPHRGDGPLGRGELRPRAPGPHREHGRHRPGGLPGQGGSTLPGYTAMAPTRPAPFARPARAAGYQVVPTQTGETATPATSQATPGTPGVLSAPATGPARSTQPAGQAPAGAPTTTPPTTPGAPAAVAPAQTKGSSQ